MQGNTHFMIGIAGGVTLCYAAGVSDPYIAAAATGTAALAALLPDIDTPHSLLNRRLWLLSPVAIFFKHRGITHSITALIIITAGVYALFGLIVASAAAVGYASHLTADAMTRAGVPLLLPVTGRKFHLLPPGARWRTGGKMEYLLAAALALAGLWLIIQWLIDFIPVNNVY
jgi:inner membrane protein